MATIDDAARVLAQVTGQPVRPFCSREGGRNQNPDARSVILGKELDNRELLSETRTRLPPGYVAFLGTTRWLEPPDPPGDEVVVAPGESQFDILRAAATDGCNYGLSTEDIISLLQQLDELVEIDIFWAEYDLVFLDFEIRPTGEDKRRFAELLHALNPGTMPDPADEPDFLDPDIQNRCLLLWWD